jgi:hypothetical protein
MATLLDSLTSLAAPAVDHIAQRLGESDASVSRGVQSSVASVLGGLLTKSTDVTATHRVFDLMMSRDNAASGADDVSSLLGGMTPSPTSGIGASLLTTLFGTRVSSVGELVARSAGFRNPSSGASILSVAAPLVLGFLMSYRLSVTYEVSTVIVDSRRTRGVMRVQERAIDVAAHR